MLHIIQTSHFPKIMDNIKKIQNYINDELQKALMSEEEYSHILANPVNYILQTKGKRIRPILTILSYQLFQKDIKQIINQAIALEILHNFTLTHDDITDAASTRRGKSTINKTYGNDIAMLVGDALLIHSLKYLHKIESKYFKDVTSAFYNMSMHLCEGQILDINYGIREAITEKEYIEMVTKKTATMLAYSLKIGSILGNAKIADQELLYNLGLYLGIAFQLEDDILDIYAPTKLWGKQIGADIINKKKTFPFVKALSVCSEADRLLLLKCFNEDQAIEENIEKIKEIYKKLNIGDLCQNSINHYYFQADAYLKLISVDECLKVDLYTIINILKRREY